jgi:hypothetical protein
MGNSTVAKKQQRKKTDRVEFKAEPAWVEQVSAAAIAADETVSQYIRKAVNERMERDQQRKGGAE